MKMHGLRAQNLCKGLTNYLALGLVNWEVIHAKHNDLDQYQDIRISIIQ